MNALLKRFLSRRSLGMVALLGLSAFAGTGPLAFGQDTVQGKLTLPVEARLGNTVLPPGEYRFHVTVAGSTLSVNSIQDVSTPVMVTVTGLRKEGPVASAVAMAFKRDPQSPKAMDIQPDGVGKMVHSLFLENLGLVLQIINNKPANTLHARGPEMARGVTSAKASDSGPKIRKRGRVNLSPQEGSSSLILFMGLRGEKNDTEQEKVALDSVAQSHYG